MERRNNKTSMVLILGLMLMGLNAFTQSAVTGQPSFGTGDALKVRPQPEPQNSVTNPIPAAPAKPISIILDGEKANEKNANPENLVQKEEITGNAVYFGAPANDKIADLSPEKQARIKAHPEQYQVSPEGIVTARGPDGSTLSHEEKLALSQKEKPQVKTITLDEFHGYPASRQGFVRENKSLFKVVDARGNTLSNY